MAWGFNMDARNDMLAALSAWVGNGAILSIYDGSKPVTPGGGLIGNVLLATATLGSPFHSNIASGILTISAAAAVITGDSTATWFRIMKADGTTWVADGVVSASQSTGDLVMSDLAFAPGGSIQFGSNFRIVLP